jgi:hypothetical protein
MRVQWELESAGSGPEGRRFIAGEGRQVENRKIRIDYSRGDDPARSLFVDEVLWHLRAGYPKRAAA